MQYSRLVDRATALSPRVIVVAMYLGNDIYDAYSVSYSLENYRGLRSQESLKIDTVTPNVMALASEQRDYHNRFGLSSVSGFSYWLREHLALGRYVNKAGLWPGSTDVDYEIDVAWARAYPNHGAVFERPPRTVFMPAYRLAAVDLNEPRIVEGLRITKELLTRMQKALEGKTRLLVVVLPSKEAAYSQVVRDQSPGSSYVQLVEMEARVRDELVATCRQQGIECISALAPLNKAIQSGSQIYMTSTSGHPVREGYAVIASTVNQELSRLGW